MDLILQGLASDLARDTAEQALDLAREDRLLAALAASNDFSNRMAAAANGVAADLQALKDEIANNTVSESTTAAVETAIANLGQIAAGLEAMDAAFPVQEPTPPPPPPEEETEVPPVEEAPGTDPIPPDSGDGSGAGGTGDGGAGDGTGTPTP